MRLIANARMYAVDAATAANWTALFARIAAMAGVPLTVIPHAAPAPLEDLWRRDDLGLAFICGYPFAGGSFPVMPIAAPIPASGEGRPLYATHLVVRVESDIAALADSFGRRLGWTVAHSQSGFNALRTHLLPHWQARGPLYARSIGPLLTPRRVIDALLADDIDIGPLDSYFHDLLLAAEPQTAARLRIVETTALRPMPLLVASDGVGEAVIARLRVALIEAHQDGEGRAILARLRLSRFAAVEPQGYRVLVVEAAAAGRAGYLQPA
ncbi:phosphate/phosphite/phosphonate ABC transporter substrate-binding protein [Bosea sp. (in: a-proteobacteria)]|uniref:phosphate/phosphite/phosphonate ABC transporter substrate-binding protein n=1 Tax=Bosea sp. (in: a-proteobacteria) TaxID=1871050 RepID=UPI002B4A4282|nr:PhnD/SsuA/transferrin family substrate-binding protein [Bosea sp. (in: a-proteobacteria)]WRH58300.1 MAG: PhnD/SsuA/transferrin family substrate-binding protein [Bosea sp. (in: a-proteobacteria)]